MEDCGRDLQMRDNLARIASSLTVGLYHKKWNGPLLRRGAAMAPIGIDAMIACHKDRVPMLAPFYKKRREFCILIDGMIAILFGIGTIRFSVIIHAHRME